MVKKKFYNKDSKVEIFDHEIKVPGYLIVKKCYLTIKRLQDEKESIMERYKPNLANSLKTVFLGSSTLINVSDINL